jgi:hypothetical protein
VSEGEDAPASESNPPSGRGRKWSLTATLAIAASLIAVAAGGIGLLFKVDPAAEPCIGGASASFVDAPVFPETRQEYGTLSHQKAAYHGDPGLVGAEVRATVDVDNLRGHAIALNYTLLGVGAGGAIDRVVGGIDEVAARTQVASSCTWRGGFDVFVEPSPTSQELSLDPRKRYRIVLELFQGPRQNQTGANRLALFETPEFRG